MTQGYCYLCQPGLVWLHILSDSLIALAYYSISLALIYCLQKRQYVPFNWLLLLFGAFIFCGGTTHIMEVWTIWHPTYWLSGFIKAMTAAVSLYTAGVMLLLMPKALALLSLEGVNIACEKEIVECQEIEAKLTHKNAELKVILDVLPDLFLWIDSDGFILNDNLDNIELAGTKITFLGKAIQELLPHKLGERIYEAVGKTLATKSLVIVDFSLLLRRGKQYYEARVVPLQENQVIAIIRNISDRKLAEEALRESEELFRATFEQASVGIAHANIDGKLVKVNQRFCDIVGYTQEELLLLRFREFTHPEDINASFENLESILSGKISNFRQEKRYIRKDGSIVWAITSVSIVREATGAPRHFVAVIQDINDRKKIETALAESEERFRATFEQAAVGIAHAGKDGRFLWLNQKFCDIVGYTKEEMLTLSFKDITHPDDLEASVEKARQLFAGEITTFSMEKRYIRKDGSVIWGNTTISLGRELSGEPKYTIGVLEDISDRKVVEIALRESGQLLAAIFERAFQLTCVLQADGTLIMANRTALDFINLQAKDVVGHSFWEIIWCNYSSPQMQAKIQDAIQRVAAGEMIRDEVQIPTADGMVHTFDFSLKPIEDKTGEVLLLILEAHDISDRKQAELALRDREQFLASIYDSVPYAIFVIDVSKDGELRYVGWNRIGELIAGIASEDARGKTAEEIFPPHMAANIQQRQIQCLQMGVSISYEDYLPFQGEDTWWITTLTPLQDTEGRIYRMIGIAANITDRKLAESALRESEERYRLLFNNSNDMIFVHGISATEKPDPFTAVNNAACFKLGYTCEELLALTTLDIVSRKTIREGPAVMEKLFSQKSALFEAAIVARNGNLIPVEVSSHMFDFRGQLTVLSIARDITERKQAESALRTSEARFRKIFADSPIGIALTLPDGKFFQINQAFCQMLGYTETELKTLNFQDITHREDLEKELPYMQQMSDGAISKYQMEKRYLKQNGDIVWTNLTCGALRDLDGKFLYRLAMIENITERLVVQRMKDDFISIVSHELRTPLTAINGALGLLATEQLGIILAEGQELLNIAVTESQRLIRLVNDILDLERIGSGHTILRKEVCLGFDLMMRAIENIKPIADKAGVTLVVSASQERVWADPDRILQLFTNLLNNAIKFSPANSTVWLEAKRVSVNRSGLPVSQDLLSQQILFEVKDEGRGIPADKLEIIFQPFEQVDASDSRQKGGTGLGLAICRSIVLSHGGQIWAESLLSKGSTFYFTLPLPPEN